MKLKMFKIIFRFINYWLSFSSWKHLYYIAVGCTKENIKQDYWDKWRWR